jgi:hypothetical protein
MPTISKHNTPSPNKRPDKRPSPVETPEPGVSHRPAVIKTAKKELEERARQRFEKEKAEYDQKMKARQEKGATASGLLSSN